MVEIVIGIISGIITAIGMGRGNSINFVTYLIFSNTAACCTSNKSIVFCSNSNYSHISKHKRKKHQHESRA